MHLQGSRPTELLRKVICGVITLGWITIGAIGVASTSFDFPRVTQTPNKAAKIMQPRAIRMVNGARVITIRFSENFFLLGLPTYYVEPWAPRIFGSQRETNQESAEIQRLGLIVCWLFLNRHFQRPRIQSWRIGSPMKMKPHISTYIFKGDKIHEPGTPFRETSSRSRELSEKIHFLRMGSLRLTSTHWIRTPIFKHFLKRSQLKSEGGLRY